MAVAVIKASLSDQLREVVGAWSKSQQRLVVLAAEFAESDEWVLDGAATAAHWIGDLADVEVSTAREWIRIGRRLPSLPATASAFEAGQLSYSKVRSLTRIANGENEAELLEIALGVPAGQLGQALAAWMNKNLTPEELADYHQSRRSLRWRTEPDGMVLFRLRLPPLLAGKLISLLMAIVMRFNPRLTTRVRPVTHSGGNASAGRWPSLAQQYADAIGQLLDEGAGEISSEIVVHVRGDGCTLDDGTPIPDSVVVSIADESFIRVLVHDAESKPINASGRQRHPTNRQKRVVKERDRVCVDCGSANPVEYDHRPAFEESGHTIVDELELRCPACHHARHEAEPSR